jgi:hypothetical protein
MRNDADDRCNDSVAVSWLRLSLRTSDWLVAGSF